MQTITTIGLDIAKSVFQVHGVDNDGKVVIRRQLKRRYVSVARFPEEVVQALRRTDVSVWPIATDGNALTPRRLSGRSGNGPGGRAHCVGRK